MFIKNSLILIISTLLISTLFINNTNAECICSGTGGDPSMISDPLVKIYGHWDFEGALFLYNKTDGYIQLPDEFRNNVQSFQSGIDACFVKFYPREQYQIKAGEYHKNYAALSNFGQRMDGLYAGACSDIICPLSN